MEGLTRMVRRAANKGDYSRFDVNDEVKVDILQLADDTIIIGNGDINNLWSLKASFRGFELISGLRVNFHKSNIYEFNLREWSMNYGSSFLSCIIDTFHATSSVL